MKLLLATFNRDKVRELRALLAGQALEVVGLYEVPGSVAPPETGRSALENARIKSRAAFGLTGFTSIADDTALEVDALGGKPGIYAARLAGPGASYEDNRRRLLELLIGVEPARRTARFRSVCYACMEGGGEVWGEGVLEGRITEDARGRGGFGYDPIFELTEGGPTLAEIPEERKNQLSHRGQAMRALLEQLRLNGALGAR